MADIRSGDASPQRSNRRRTSVRAYIGIRRTPLRRVCLSRAHSRSLFAGGDHGNSREGAGQ